MEGTPSQRHGQRRVADRVRAGDGAAYPSFLQDTPDASFSFYILDSLYSLILTLTFVRFQLHTTHIDQVTTQLGLVHRQCSITFRIL